MISLDKRLGFILLGAASVLLIPLIAMQFTSEVNWTTGDFLVAGILLLSTAFICELTWRKLRDSAYRTWILLGIFILFLLIWAELAVGIFGTALAGS
ncbi:hypothetical protein [Muriicola soli]|uniref:Uncharacterized protein n=1 Tax=Muriicola soli TaxID=2507538 RepID=A0A411E8J5_9FLAO|nr:hypothetical protein [Muriicola soli]QBA64041.1 hypothetical protein EQY75_05510 [Muriicola soli]